MLRLLLLLIFLIAVVVILLLDWLSKLVLTSHIFCNEKAVLVLSLLFLTVSEAHLLVVWGSENILGLGFISKFPWENLTFNILVRLNIIDGECYSLSHHFSIQIISLYVLL